MRHILLGLAIVGGISQATAQESGPRSDAILARAERGDPSARKEAESIGWLWIKRVASEGRLNPADARSMARTMLLIEGPLPSLEAPPTDGDRIWRSAAINALEMVIHGDSSDVWSAVQLANIAPYPFLWASVADERNVLNALVARKATLPAQIQLRRIRIELEAGSLDSAAAWFATLPSSATSTAGRGHLAAEIDFGMRRDSAASAEYYRGAGAIDDSASAEWYERDLGWIAEPEEMSEWRATPFAARGKWLERFWNGQDLFDGQLPGTRLPEQFRRWRIALRNYRWDTDGSTARAIIVPIEDGNDYNMADKTIVDRPFLCEDVRCLNRVRPLTRLVDDRGGLILRHGEPFQIANLPGTNPLQESMFKWLTPDGAVIVSFSRMAVKDLYGVPVQSQRFGMVARNYPVGDMDAGCHVDNQLCLPLDDVRYRLIRLDYERMRKLAESTDGNPETFATELEAGVQVYGIPDRGVLVVFAVPTRTLIPRAEIRNTITAAAARLRVVVGDAKEGTFAAALDTVRSWTLHSAPTDSTQLTGYTLVPTAAGLWSVSVVLSDLARSAGSGRPIDGVPAPDFDGKTLQLSDLILGSKASGLSWKLDGVDIPLNPRNAWHTTESAVLTYQVDGMVRGHRYETAIEIWDGDARAKSFRTSIGFTSPATGIRDVIQRELSLRELPRGDYRVIVRVRDAAGGPTVVQQRHLAVR